MKPREQKRHEAEKRQAKHDALSTSQKIDKALERPGMSTRELHRLGAKLNKEKS